MPIPPGLLADPEELAETLGVPADNRRMLDALRNASRRFIGDVRHPVALVTSDEVWLDCDGSASLLLPAAPVLARPRVELDGQALEEGEFDWSEKGILERRRGCWPRRLRCVRVVYDHGYDPIPVDIQAAVLAQAESAFRSVPGVSSMQVGGMTVSYGAAAAIGVTQQWADAVTRYTLNRGDRA
ncbi:hypothetical protein [Microtetraspora niveoalba]|uniref:hypothetical protein n=1 Tax=Microtetraspora niveoalba TaxID=46175 RepID=UPI0008335FCD|nr:hypothetical protein [Microtetraspora niveoalba]